MSDRLGTLLPSTLAVFVLVMALFGGMSYGAYQFMNEGSTRHQIAQEANKDNTARIHRALVELGNPETAVNGMALGDQKAQLESSAAYANWASFAFIAGVIGSFIVLLRLLRPLFQ